MATPTPFERHDRPRLTRSVQALLAINVAMLFLQWTVVSDADAFAVLGFQAGSLQRTLWSALTYMFVHYGVWHLALNMYALLVFGPRLEAAMGTRAFTLYYLWCGLGGAVAHMLFVRTGLLVGASAARARRDVRVLAAVARRGDLAVRRGPDASVDGAGAARGSEPRLGRDRRRRRTSRAERGSRTSRTSAGIAFAWLYMRTPPAASIERLRQRISPAPDYPHDETAARDSAHAARARSAQRDDVDEIVAKSKAVAAQQRTSDDARGGDAGAAPREERAAELDRVLDKISLEGLDSLTTDERAVLDEMAKRLRGEDGS